jgi:hypothetical protein
MPVFTMLYVSPNWGRGLPYVWQGRPASVPYV